MSYTVEKGVTMPPCSKYPFAEMAVGDSFALEKVDYHRITSAAYDYGKRNNVKFTARVVGSELRLWRSK